MGGDLPQHNTGATPPARPNRRATAERGKPARAVKGAERLARDIVRRIYEGGMQPGDKFLSEAEALSVFGVSRATLREALRYLQIQGVLVIRSGPGGGHFVGKPQPESLASTLALLLQFSKAPINCIIDARRIIEPAIVREAARKATPADIAALDVHLAAIARGIDDDASFIGAYAAFGDAVIAAAGNELLKLLIPALFAIGRSGGFASTPDGRDRAYALSARLREAIAAHDPEAAGRIVEDVHVMIAEVLEAHYIERLGRPVSWADVQDVL
jgi:DNA-binding FadR family transcriptional regulator